MWGTFTSTKLFAAHFLHIVINWHTFHYAFQLQSGLRVTVQIAHCSHENEIMCYSHSSAISFIHVACLLLLPYLSLLIPTYLFILFHGSQYNHRPKQTKHSSLWQGFHEQKLPSKQSSFIWVLHIDKSWFIICTSTGFPQL